MTASADGLPTSDPHAVTSLQVQRAARGDDQSLDWVIRHLSPWLLTAARYRIGPSLRALYDPEDLVSEVWLITLPRLPNLSARGGRLTPVLLKFMSTTMVHRANRLLERHVLGKPLRRDPLDSHGEPTMAPLADDATGIVSHAIRGERQAAVLAAIDELSEQDRAVLVLRGIEQNSVPAVAAELGLPAGTVAVRYHRALTKLRQRFPASVAAELFDDLA